MSFLSGIYIITFPSQRIPLPLWRTRSERKEPHFCSPSLPLLPAKQVSAFGPRQVLPCPDAGDTQDSSYSHGTARTHSMVQTHDCYLEHRSIPDLSMAGHFPFPEVQGTWALSLGCSFDIQDNDHAHAEPTFSCIHTYNAHSYHKTSIPCAQGDQHTYFYLGK